MSVLVGNPDCWFSQGKAQVGFHTKVGFHTNDRVSIIHIHFNLLIKGTGTKQK